MNGEPKIDALLTCHDALNTLGLDDRKWVIAQLSSRIGVSSSRVAVPTQGSQPLDEISKDSEPSAVDASDGDDFAELFSQANPKTEDQKVLFASWLLYGKNGIQNFKGLDVSRKLKLTGHEVNNLSMCLIRLGKLKPALVVQMGKDGNSRQARKSYRITSEGCKAAQKLQSGHSNGEATEGE